jgi:hypothetical protein
VVCFGVRFVRFSILAFRQVWCEPWRQALSNDEFVTVPVLVPRERLGDLYAIVGGWTQPAGTRPANGAGSDTDLRWHSDDWQVADDVVAAGGTNARAIYRVLAANAGQPVSYEQLDQAVNMDGLRRVGVLGSIGKSCSHRGREVPWTWDRDHATYTMAPLVAELFRTALSKR